MPELRDPSFKETDKTTLHDIAQAGLNVQLFRIPLVMTALYSLQGTRSISGQNRFYYGRRWPGMAPSGSPLSCNETAFNILYGMHMENLLAMQLAANVCRAIGAAPRFMDSALHAEDGSWKCYGPNCHVIPHIIDLRDCLAPYDKIIVDTGELNTGTIELLELIYADGKSVWDVINNNKKPMIGLPAGITTQMFSTESLPFFGSLNRLYYSFIDHLFIHYSDGTTLWDYVYQPDPCQKEIFNDNSLYQKPEYPGITTSITAVLQDEALAQLLELIRGMMDKAGTDLFTSIKPELETRYPGEDFSMLRNVTSKLPLPDRVALQENYPAYTPSGTKKDVSPDATAREYVAGRDHYELIKEIARRKAAAQAVGDTIVTWADWHSKGSVWDKEMLMEQDYAMNAYALPEAEDIAAALNRLKENDTKDNYTYFSRLAAASLKSVLVQLEAYWNDKVANISYSSIRNCGDRIALAWAIFGKAPNLSIRLPERNDNLVYHACNNLSVQSGEELDMCGRTPGPDETGTNDKWHSCASIQAAHSCRGLNSCAKEGGCGLIQNMHGADSCSLGGKRERHADHHGGYINKAESADLANDGYNDLKFPEAHVEQTQYVLDSAPGHNKCGGYGGCAVPVSASQVYGAPFPAEQGRKANAIVFELLPKIDKTEFFGKVKFRLVAAANTSFDAGDNVYDVAWNAYVAAMKSRDQSWAKQLDVLPADYSEDESIVAGINKYRPTAHTRSKPSDIQLALPPNS